VLNPDLSEPGVSDPNVNHPVDLEAELREDVRLLGRLLWRVPQERTRNCASSLV